MSQAESVGKIAVAVKEKCIHEDFFINARSNPGQEALLWDEHGISRSMTYGELADKALRLAALLITKGVGQGTAVAITLPRGPEQVIAVLAVLSAGAAYIPVGVNQPAGRRKKIYRTGGCSHLVTDKTGASLLPALRGITVILPEEAAQVLPLPCPVAVGTDALAYVIFTSGSSGEPKGVEIAHSAAYNTIVDINTRFSVSESDRLLAVSALDFDLSVYDLFGLLAAGGGIVLLNEGTEREAAVWPVLVRSLKVTIWNSVPALLDMLLIADGEDAVLPSLRLVLVSGDWVGLDLPGRVRKKTRVCRFIALGGATEAAIWSNYFEAEYVDPAWSSIPYGKPLTNQCFRIVDRLGCDCPPMATGELWIGGKGVACGYRGNSELTARSFVNWGDNRWYRTGDLGRYWPDGNIEFLGRADQQVKLKGYRIELGEIEAVLRQYPGVSQAVAALAAGAGAQHLVAAVVAGFVPGQVHSTSSVSANASSGSCRDSSWEMQSQIAEAFMAEILDLAALWKDTGKNLNSVRQLPVADENQPLLRMWLRWLGERQVITEQAGDLYVGPRLGEVLQYADTLKRGAAGGSRTAAPDCLLSILSRRLFARREDYRSMLHGEISPAVLLDDDVLSPESLAAIDPGTVAGIVLLASKIKQLAKASGKPVVTALIGGRSGTMAARLLELLEPEDICLTLLDSAPSMVEAASRRLSSLPHAVACKRMPDNRVPEQFRYAFDLVLAIHSLHRYRDPHQGVAIASLLLRRGGRIFVLEHGELTPIAAVTAAVLEQGFAGLDFERRQAFSPMLPASRWAKLFIQAGFHNVNFAAVETSLTAFIEAECPAARPEPEPDGLLNFAAAHLPAYMLPENIEILPWLPLSANGKVDRTSVAGMFAYGAEAEGYEQPRAGIEQEIAAMWQELLDSGAIGSKQGFFEIGGDSLLATRFLAAVKEEFGVEFSLRQLIEAPALFQVAATLESKLAARQRTLAAMEEGEI